MFCRSSISPVIGLFALLTTGASVSPDSRANLAYDQIGRVLTGATPPPPNSFAADAARIGALPPMPATPGAGVAGSTALGVLSAVPLVGVFAGMAQQAASIAYARAMQAYSASVAAAGKAYVNAGAMQHAWFYHGWSRVDTTSTHSGVIEKPDIGETIFLDLAAKTYRVQRDPTPGVQTYVVSDDAASGTSVSVAVQNDAHTQPLAARTIAGLPAHGYRTSATFTTSGPIGWCTTGAHALDETEYVTDLRDPQNPPGAPLTFAQIANEVCSPANAGSHYSPGSLFVFRSTSLTGTVSGDVVFVTERDNIHLLGPSGAAAFDVPIGFTERDAP